MWKDLKEKAVDIQNKKYVLVSDRIIYFNDTYKDWSIVTSIENLTENSVIMKATIKTWKEWQIFTWFAQEVNDGNNFINKTSMIENAETSAVGRALAMMWIWVIDSIASVDEIKKATNSKFNDKITWDYYCVKCWAENKGIEIKKWNYWPYFKCNHCNEFSNTKKQILDWEDMSKKPEWDK